MILLNPTPAVIAWTLFTGGLVLYLSAYAVPVTRWVRHRSRLHSLRRDLERIDAGEPVYDERRRQP
jgi:hypothetical protein